MLSGYSDWLVLAAVILVSDVVLWWAAYLAGRRGVLREIASNVAAESAEGSVGEVESPAYHVELKEGITHLDSRLSEIHDDLRRLGEDTSGLRSDASPQAEGVLDFAARLAQRGSGVDELVELCDLGRSEAELIHALHSESAAAVA